MRHEKLHVIAVMSNPVRYKSRPRLFKEFMARIEKNPHVELYVVEAAFGHRDFEVTESCNPKHIQLRTHDELWHKENMINIGVSRLPAHWKYVAWIDGDVEFMSDNWAEETLHQLQHYEIVQMFRDAIDLGPKGEVMHVHKGFAYSHLHALPYSRQYGGWHPGYCWAYTRDAWNALGGLIDFAMVGSGDDHMAKCLIGKGADSIPKGLHKNYVDAVLAWEKRAEHAIKRDIGYVQMTIRHFFHGKKKNRKYWERWSIAKDHNFDPLTHLKRDWQGLWQLTDHSIGLRDDLRAYFRARNEDSVDLE